MLGPVLEMQVRTMTVALTETRFSRSDPAPILLLGSSEAAIAKARPAIEAFGLRVAEVVDLAAAPERLRRQAAASAVWLELGPEADALPDELVEGINRDAADERHPVLVSACAKSLDPLAAQLDPSVELLIDADASERVSALALMLTAKDQPVGLHDVASDQTNARLRQLSDEVSRIASTLARLSAGPGHVAPRAPVVTHAEAPEVSAEAIRSLIRARRLRANYFSEELFADPAWDMLLDLLHAEILHLRVPVSSLCIAAAVPATTALRWLKTMVSEGIFIRRADPHDGRRVFVELAPETSEALRRYFAEVGQLAVL